MQLKFNNAGLSDLLKVLVVLVAFGHPLLALPLSARGGPGSFVSDATKASDGTSSSTFQVTSTGEAPYNPPSKPPSAPKLRPVDNTPETLDEISPLDLQAPSSES